MDTALWTIGGLIAGSLVTWFFARYYYLRSARERPDWMADVLVEIKVAAATGNAEPGDLVAIFEAALKDHNIVIDGGTF